MPLSFGAHDAAALQKMPLSQCRGISEVRQPARQSLQLPGGRMTLELPVGADENSVIAIDDRVAGLVQMQHLHTLIQ